MTLEMLNELNLLIEEKKKEEKVEGTYVACTFDKATVKKIKDMIKKLKVPNPLPSAKYHTTTIFSRNKFPDDFKALGKLDPSWKGTPVEFDIFTGRDQQKCLVLKYNCNKQKERHHELMDKYKATYDWPEYKMHLTLSYDCGDFDHKKHDPKEYIDEIVIDSEYTEPLQLDWLAKK